MLKQKPCKGHGKAKGFKGCGNMVDARIRKYGLCPGCYGDWLYQTPEGQEKLNKALLKAKQPREELEEAAKEKKRREGLTTLLKSVKDVCHKYIRLRDKGKPCISSGIPWKSDFQAGHFFKAELYPWVRFHEHNINGQSILDNCLKDGNFQGYSENLPKRIGQENYDELCRLAEEGKKTPFKWDREELKRIRKYYNDKIKEL